MSLEEIPAFISNKHNLVYNNTIDSTDILNILFISSDVYESQLFYDSVNQNTFPIIYSADSKGIELIELLRAKFQNGIQRISFAFHNPLNNIKTFLDNLPFFDAMDLMENQTTFSQNFTFLTQLITEFRVINCDFLACGTLQYSGWTRYYDLLNRLTGVICGASNDNTGNIQYGANWIMENTNENIRDLYFTSSINNYASYLGSFIIGDLQYTTVFGSNDTVYVRRAASTPSGNEIVIPSQFQYNEITYTVTGIYTNAFMDCTGLTGVTIPNTVTIIGTNAFRNCTGLTSISIPGSVVDIGEGAFYNCTALINVEFDNHIEIKNLGTGVFNLANVAPTNKTVKFWRTANYGELTDPIGQTIAGYFNTVEYSSASSCFNEDTKILCLNRDGQEEYIPIQNLRKGDLVKSYLHGYRKIDLIGKGRMINNIDVWNDSMYILEKTDDNGLIEDLIVTGGHALLVDQLSDQDLQNYRLNNVFDNGQPIMIDDKFLLLAGLSSLFKQLTEQKKFTYYHLILESNHDDERFGVYANGILTETPSKKHFTAHPYTLL